MEKYVITNDDKISELYLRHKFTKIAQDEAIDRIDWIVDSAKGKTVLDIGCSQGISSLLLAKRGFNVIGIDINPAAIEFAENEKLNLTKEEQKKISFKCIDLNSFVIKSKKSFDNIILGEVIEHYANPLQILDEATKLLNKNGQLILTTPFGLKPNDDHKSIFFPSNIVELIPNTIRPTYLDIQNSFIKLIGIYDSNKKTSKKPNNHDIDLLKLTEKGVTEIQSHLLSIIKRQNYVLKKITTANKNNNTSKIESSLGDLVSLTTQTVSNQASILNNEETMLNSISSMAGELVLGLSNNFLTLQKVIESTENFNSNISEFKNEYNTQTNIKFDEFSNSISNINNYHNQLKLQADKILDDINNVAVELKSIAKSTGSLSLLTEEVKQINSDHKSSTNDIIKSNSEILSSISSNKNLMSTDKKLIIESIDNTFNEIKIANKNSTSEVREVNQNLIKTEGTIIKTVNNAIKTISAALNIERAKEIKEQNNLIIPYLTELSQSKLADQNIANTFSRSIEELDKTLLRQKRIIRRKNEELKSNLTELEQAKEKANTYKSLVIDYQDKFSNAKKSFLFIERKMSDWRKKSIVNKNDSKQKGVIIDQITKVKAFELEQINNTKNLEIHILTKKLEEYTIKVSALEALVKSNQDIFAHAKESYLNIEKRHTKLKKLLSSFRSNNEEELTEKDKITLKRHRDVIESKTYKISTSILDRLTGKQTYLSLPKNLYKIIKPPKQKQLT